MGNYLLVPFSLKVVRSISENTGCFPFLHPLAPHPASCLHIYSCVQLGLLHRGQALSLGMACMLPSLEWHCVSITCLFIGFLIMESFYVFRLISSLYTNLRIFAFFSENQLIWNFKKISMVLLEYLQRTLVQLISITPVPTKEMLAGVPALRSLVAPSSRWIPYCHC